MASRRRSASRRTGSSSGSRATLPSQVADEQPALGVDDAQWLDRASAQALAFVARRLSAEAVALVFAEREPSRELAGLPELVVAGLADDDARAVLESVVTGPLDGRVRDRIVAETNGNPLALIELPHGLTHAELAGWLPRRRPVRHSRGTSRRASGGA